MDEPNIRGTTRRELLGGAAVVLGSPVLGFREDTPEPSEEEPGGNCGGDYDAEYEELFEAAEDVEVDDRSLAAKWTRPIRKRARVTMRYRVRGNWLVGYHTGVDLAVPKGTPVYAVGTGVVVLASWSGSYGKAVTIKMSDSRYVLYAHLSRISVARGAKVKAGTRIGSSGATGRATGPHLHFEVRSRRPYGSDIDPVKYLARHGLSL
ncbi:M23 family metallopeptidase [Streptomyces sp. NBC_00882]|uniref:M23 family metallopeptidase n=1 Tax=Streptomyces TaxID=1883 RepID=UPI003863E63D|nr:M23 family metallopeptidase [Streptomyces canus]WSZ33206.1 M23 family metallopeptidase [Streptomyces sp. NBC_00882]WSZ60151.1 M23 family metallopeptidase [Streptomyces canus]